MRESKFVEQNLEKWQQFETDLSSNKAESQHLRQQFIQVTDDLSYARTYYKNRSVRIYLNNLAQNIHKRIVKNKGNFLASLKQFFLFEVPKISYLSRKELLFSFVVLLLSVLIGLFSSWQSKDFAVSILGEGYINTTLENIKKGDPFGIYKSQNMFSMFFDIAHNNLRVSLIVFIFGIFASYGSIFIMIRNGIMLGVFMFFFYSRNLATEFNLTVWMHGSIEILTLVVETQAGMLLGRGLLYPGTYSRAKAFSIWGRRGVMLFFSTIPFIVFAAFIESFITRFTSIPDVLRAVFILASVVLMVFYFVVFPYIKFNNEKDVQFEDPVFETNEDELNNRMNIQTSFQNFYFSLRFYFQNFDFYIIRILALSIGFVGVITLLYNKSWLNSFQITDNNSSSDFFGGYLISHLFNNFNLVFINQLNLVFNVFHGIWFGLLSFFTLKFFFKKQLIEVKNLNLITFTSVIIIISELILFFTQSVVFYYLILTFLLVIVILNQISGLQTIGKNLSLFINFGFLKSLFSFLIILIVSFIAVLLLISPIKIFIEEFVQFNFNMSDQQFLLFNQLSNLFLYALLASIIHSFFTIKLAFLSQSILEIGTAQALKNRINQLGNTRKILGMETEI